MSDTRKEQGITCANESTEVTSLRPRPAGVFATVIFAALFMAVWLRRYHPSITDILGAGRQYLVWSHFAWATLFDNCKRAHGTYLRICVTLA